MGAGAARPHRRRLSRTRTPSDFAARSDRITAAGLLKPRPGYYALRLTAVALALAGGWAAFFVIGASWWQLPVGAVLAVVFGQVALGAHDPRRRPAGAGWHAW